jgi:hypothetical protein
LAPLGGDCVPKASFLLAPRGPGYFAPRGPGYFFFHTVQNKERDVIRTRFYVANMLSKATNEKK